MNIKSILTYPAILTLSFNVFATEVQEQPKMTAAEQVALNQENSPAPPPAPPIVNSHTIPQASAEKPSEFLTSLSVYLIIIIVYSIYGFKANAKNAGN
ncbi:MAG: hypothetical protein QX199_18720 [Methylococcaceae bacterium]